MGAGKRTVMSDRAGINAPTKAAFCSAVTSAGASRAKRRNELRRESGPREMLFSTTPKPCRIPNTVVATTNTCTTQKHTRKGGQIGDQRVAQRCLPCRVCHHLDVAAALENAAEEKLHVGRGVGSVGQYLIKARGREWER